MRLHPLYANKKECIDFKNYEKKHKNINFIYPKSECGWPGDMNQDEIQLSSLLVANSELIITSMSTMILDTIIFNKSVVNISFDWKKNELVPLKLSLQENRIHIKRVKDAKNIFHARSKSELESFINNKIRNKNKNSERKKNTTHRLVKQECGQIDGLVIKRITKYLFD